MTSTFCKIIPMTRCPHCRESCNPLRFLIYTKWTHYRCPKCGKRSEFSTKQLAVLGGIGGGIGGGLASFISRDYGWQGFTALILGLTLLNMLGIWLFLDLNPIKAEQGGDGDAEQAV